MQQENFENDDVQDLGTLVSEKVTADGFLQALFDIMFMGMFLAGAMVCIIVSVKLPGFEWCAVLAIGILLFEKWIQYYWRVMHPLTSYQTIRVFEKNGKTTTIVE